MPPITKMMLKPIAIAKPKSDIGTNLVLVIRCAGQSEIFRQQFGRLALKIEVRQDPTLTGHLEVETKVDKSKIFDMRVMDDLTKGPADLVIDYFLAEVYRRKRAMHFEARREKRAARLPR